MTEPKEEERQETPSGVLVTRTYDEEGTLSVGFQAVGDVRQAEIPTLLEFAAKAARARLGLG